MRLLKLDSACRTTKAMTQRVQDYLVKLDSAERQPATALCIIAVRCSTLKLVPAQCVQGMCSFEFYIISFVVCLDLPNSFIITIS